MSSENEYFSENEETQPDTINLDNSPSESATVEHETGEHDDQHDENVKDERKVVKPKRIITNPQPKFNEQTIRTVKGLPAVVNHFKDVKFKGHGFEEQDLNRLMKIYEYWCHRFFPKFTFDDSIQRLEYLGNKKSTQVYLKKVRLGIEDVFEEHISEEKIETEGFVEPFDDQFNNLLSTDNNHSEPELTEDQLELMNQNKLRAEAIRKERLSRINGETSQQYTLNTVVQNHDNEAHNVEMEPNEELGIDNILKMVNEDSDSSSCEAVQDINKEQLYDKKISNAIRRNAISDSESEQSDLTNDKVTRLQKENSDQNRKELGDNSDHLNSSTSSNESAVLCSSQLKKKKSKSFKKIKNSQSSFRKKRKISTDSDDDLNKSNLTHKSQQNKMIVDSDEDNVQRPSQSHFTKKNNLIETSDSDNEQPVQSNMSINSSIKENLHNISDVSLKQNVTNYFLDSDQESDSLDGTGKFKQKGRLIIDTDESD